MKRKIKKIKRIVSLIVAMVIISSCSEKHYNEWVVKGGKKMYYTNAGNIIKNTYDTIGGNTYVFDENGYVITNKIVNLDGNLRIADNEGRIMIGGGWCKINDGNDYYLNNGKVQTGWIKDGENWYYLDSNYYYKLKNQWVENEYYVDNNGKMVSNGWYTINGKKYYFDTTGKVDRNRMNITFRNIPYKQRISRSRFEADDIYCTVSSIYFENKKAWCKGVIEDTHGREYPLCDATVYYRIYDGKNRIISSKKIYIEHSERNSKYFEVNFNFPFYEIDENDNYVIEITGMNYGLY